MNSLSPETETEEFVQSVGMGSALYTVKRLLRVRLAGFGFAIILLVILCAIFAPWIAPYDPLEQHDGHYLEGPSKAFLLGTDQMGRDTLTRIIYASRIALLVSLGAIGLAVSVGTPLGLLAAYIGGWTDAVIGRIVDAVFAFPSLIIAIAIVTAIGDPSLWVVIVAIGTAHGPIMARIVRSQALSVREQDYVKAAEAVGGNTFRIVFRHIWPNCTAPIIIQATLGLAYAILTEAVMGFLGIGVQPPDPTWGNMLKIAYPFLERSPILSVAPGMTIFLTVLGFNFVGDSLRDVLDPRLRGLI